MVPTDQLEKACIDLLDKHRDQFSGDKILPHEFWSYASNELAEPFEVNPIVIEIRINRQNLVHKFVDYYNN